MGRRDDRRRTYLGVRLSTTIAATAVAAVALLLGGITLVGMLDRSLTAALESTAATRARDVVSLVHSGRPPRLVASSTEESSVVQVIGPSGAVLASSPNIAGEPAFTARPTSRKATTVNRTKLPIGSSDEMFLIFRQPVTLSSGEGWVYVAISEADVTATVRRVETLLVVGLPLVLAVLALTTWVAVGRALRPVELIRSRAAAIGGSDLQARVPVPGGDDAVSRLAVTMNEMLTRLDDAATRQRRFVGDASHELRSPLAAMQALVDVARLHPGLADTKDVLARVADQTQRMSRLIDDLLFLARADERGADRRTESVDLDELVLAEADRLRQLGTVDVVVDGPVAIRVTGSRRDLARMIRNVGDNAASHARRTVELGLRVDDNCAVITVADDGPGILDEQQTKIFERFGRLDEARTRPILGAGVGLGLPIAKEIADVHGGRITVGSRDVEGAGATFVVTLPLTPGTTVRGESTSGGA